MEEGQKARHASKVLSGVHPGTGRGGKTWLHFAQTPQEVMTLMTRYGDSLGALAAYWHTELFLKSYSLNSFLEEADKDFGPFSHHLRIALAIIEEDSQLIHTTRQVLRGTTPSKANFYRLKSAGILLGDSPESARFRCALYKKFYARNLL